MAPPSPLPPLVGVLTAAYTPTGAGGAEFECGLPASAAAAPNCRGHGDRDACDRPAVCRVPGRMPELSLLRPAARRVPRAAHPRGG